MTWVSSFSEGSLAVEVTYQTSTLFSGSIGLNGSVDFEDANSDFTCTLSVGSDGIISLVSTADPGNWTGGQYIVSLALPSSPPFDGIQLIQCASDPAVFGGTQLASLSDGTATDFEGTTFVYGSLPVGTFGMGATPGGA
jgi:hypothetical protein